MLVEPLSNSCTQEFAPTKEDLSLLREWIAKKPYILQDYGNLQKAKAALETINGLGYRYPKSFGHMDPLNKTTQIYLNANFHFCLPKRTEDGSLVFFLTAKKDEGLDLKNFSWYENHRLTLLLQYITIWEKLEGNNKIIYVYDATHETFNRYKNVTPTSVRDLAVYIKHYPIRFQAIHFIKAPSYLVSMIDFAKKFAKNKMIQRLHFHNNIDSLYGQIPRAYLPEEYGGSESSITILDDLLRKKLESYRHRLIKESDKMRKLDPLRPKSEELDHQELAGTFRQLSFD